MQRRKAGDSTIGLNILDRPPDQAETVFNLRIGPDYKKNGRKGPSGPPLYDTVGLDIFRSDRKIDDAATFVDLPSVPPSQDRVVNGVPPLFIVNVQMPRYDPPNPVWGQVKDDGPGFIILLYLRIRPETQLALENLSTAPAAIKLLHGFIHKDELRVRFKALANMLNGHELDLGFTLRKLMTDYNMKPILTRPQHRFYTDHESYFEAVVDVHQFSYLCRRGFASLRPIINTVIYDVGFTIEGHTDDELPENILCVVHLRRINLETVGQDIVADEAIRQQRKKKTPKVPNPEVSVTTPTAAPISSLSESQISTSSVAVVDSPQKEVVIPFTSKTTETPLSSMQSSTLPLLASKNLLVASFSNQTLAAKPPLNDDDEFYDADEEFYDADS